MSTIKASRALPISIGEFSEALFSIWRSSAGLKRPNIGLAISGGVDSMALAALCKSLSTAESARIQLRCTAFIVDHKLRKESSEEAEQVARWLEKQLGIGSHILPISWPPSGGLSGGAIEAHARRERFRALGSACRSAGIDQLLLAHHRDDIAETVLMRILTGRRGNALQGIQPVKDIPECYDMHGVYQSGGLDDPLGPKHQLDYGLPSSKTRARIETGGVQLLRPLLRFNKARLIATCKKDGIPWVEDPTNVDPTFTLRNAIRHVFQHHALPPALQKESLIMTANRVTLIRQERERTASRLYPSLKMKLDIRSGTLWVQFPQSVSPSEDIDPARLRHWQSVAALLLRKVLTLVSPQPEILLPDLSTTLSHIFPALDPERPSSHLPPPSFTTSGVLIQRDPLHGIPSSWPHTSSTYLLCRQPPNKDPYSAPIVLLPPPSSSSASSDSPLASPASNAQIQPFTLYDNRFWLRLHNPFPPSTHTLLLRPLRATDLAEFRAALTPSMRKVLAKRIRECAAGGRVYTLPAVVLVERPYEEVEEVMERVSRGKKAGEKGDILKGRVLALPTLDVAVDAKTRAMLRWEWRYRKIEYEGMLVNV